MTNRLVTATVFQPLYVGPSRRSIKILDLPPGSILQDITTIHEGEFINVVYPTNKKFHYGYVLSKWAEPYTYDVGRILRIRMGTASSSDAAQYIIYKDSIQYNLCGELCVLYCANWFEAELEEWLDAWESKSPNFWNSVFKNGRSRTTGISDLNKMLDLFDGYQTPMITIQSALMDADLERPLMTPGRILDVLYDHRIIIGCKIEGQFGRLRPSGIAHWVVVESIEPEGRGGLVKIYNPFSNRAETYTWEQFVESVKTPYGILVPR